MAAAAADRKQQFDGKELQLGLMEAPVQVVSCGEEYDFGKRTWTAIVAVNDPYTLAAIEKLESQKQEAAHEEGEVYNSVILSDTVEEDGKQMYNIKLVRMKVPVSVQKGVANVQPQPGDLYIFKTKQRGWSMNGQRGIYLTSADQKQCGHIADAKKRVRRVKAGTQWN